MPPERCVISCSVLSLQDYCVFYPSCQNCASRLQKKESDLRFRCPKCCFQYEVQNVSYRYRLSLNVKRRSDIFGVTVFGSCLNPYFGISAGGLQRFVEETKRKAGNVQSGFVQTVLIKAVEDCFVGRRFEIGVKLPGNEVEEGPSFAERKISGLFVASQITLPNGACRGSPVLSYFRKLLQATGLADINISQQAGRLPTSPEHNDPTALSSFECSPASCMESPSQHRRGASVLAGYCLQSPGIVTSSAEQEESSCSEPNGDHPRLQRGRKLQRTPQSFLRNASSQTLPSQYRLLDTDGKVKQEDSSQDSCFGSSAVCRSAEAAGTSPSHGCQFSPSSLPDADESTMLDSKTNHDSLEHSEIVQELDQNKSLCLEIGWRREAFAEGKDDVSCFQEGLSVSGRNSSLSDSSAWADIPFSESWGEFISKVNGFSDKSTKDNMHSPVKKKENKLGNTDCTDRTHKEADSHYGNVSCACKYSCNAVNLFRETAYDRRSSQVNGEVGKLRLSQSFAKSPGMCCKENVSWSANVQKAKESNALRAGSLTGSTTAHKCTFNQISHAPEFPESSQGDMQLSGSSFRAHTDQTLPEAEAQDTVPQPGISGVPVSKHSDCTEDENKESSRVGGEAKKGATFCHSNRRTAVDEQDGRGAAFCSWGWDEGLQWSGLLCAEDDYNASADLFNSCQSGTNAEEGEDDGLIRVPRQLGHAASQRSKGCPLRDVNLRDHAVLEQTRKSSDKTCTLVSEPLSSLDFVPFSQSTPISERLGPLHHPQQRGNNQTHSRLEQRGQTSAKHHLKPHDSDYQVQSRGKKACRCERETGIVIPPSIKGISHSSKLHQRLRSLTKDTKEHKHVGRYHCKRILLASCERSSSWNSLSQKTDNTCVSSKVTEIGQRLSLSTHVLSSPKMGDCGKKANVEIKGPNVSEAKNLDERVVCGKQSLPEPVASAPGAECDGAVYDCSADLFADSFGN